MRENRLLPCIFRKFPTFSSTSKSNTLLVNSYVVANPRNGDAKLIIYFDTANMLFSIYLAVSRAKRSSRELSFHF
jgi:hypothetical protein